MYLIVLPIQENLVPGLQMLTAASKHIRLLSNNFCACGSTEPTA